MILFLDALTDRCTLRRSTELAPCLYAVETEGQLQDSLLQAAPCLAVE